MRFNLLSVLPLATLGLVASTANAADVQNVYIDESSGLVCLILPPKGQIIGNTQTIGVAHCTNGKGDTLLPPDFFVTKKFQTTADYVQAWGIMSDASVGMLTSDGGGQYDIHADSGTNRAPGYAVFVELLEPDTGRWCIRFCHELSKVCNMGDSSAGCEGALGITDWPAAGSIPAPSNSTKTTLAKGTATATGTAKGTATASISGGASSAPTGTASSIPSAAKNGSMKTVLGAIVPFAVLSTSLFALLF